MGVFQTAVHEQRKSAESRRDRWVQIIDALKEKNDGSYEEFVEIMEDRSIPDGIVAKAISETTGVSVHRTTVNVWRVNGRIREQSADKRQ